LIFRNKRHNLTLIVSF